MQYFIVVTWAHRICLKCITAGIHFRQITHAHVTVNVQHFLYDWDHYNIYAFQKDGRPKGVITLCYRVVDLVSSVMHVCIQKLVEMLQNVLYDWFSPFPLSHTRFWFELV